MSTGKVTLKAAERLLVSQPITDGENIQKTAGDRFCLKLQALYLANPNTAEKLTSTGPLDILMWPGATTKFLLLHDRGLIVGYLKLVKEDFNIPGVHHYVNESYIKVPYRGKGYGTLMYALAIKSLKGLASSANMGTMAVRTWHALARKKIKVRLWCTTFDKEFKLVWGTDGIPVVHDKPINKQREEYVFFVSVMKG